MGATVYYQGSAELATLTQTFTADGSPTDPTTVTLVVTSPSGVETTTTDAGLTHTPGSGVYSLDVACTEAGTWQYVWTGTGTVSDVVAGTWTVQTTAVGQDYCTVEELKSRLRITNTADDFELRDAANAASRQIDDYCQRRFWRMTETRTYPPDDWYHTTVDDLVSVTSLQTDTDADGVFETVWTADDYQLLPFNPQRYGAETWPYTRIRAIRSIAFPTIFSWPRRRNLVQVTGVFGWPQVPSAVRQAAAIIGAQLFKLREAPFGVAGFGDYGPVRLRLNPAAERLLDPYRRFPAQGM